MSAMADRRINWTTFVDASAEFLARTVGGLNEFSKPLHDDGSTRPQISTTVLMSVKLKDTLS